MGSLAILNTGKGDITLSFNPHNPDELKKALTMLADMQKRGYAILVKEADGSYVRAQEVDPNRGVYVIVAPELPAAPEPAALPPAEFPDPQKVEAFSKALGSTEEPKKRGRPRKTRREVPVGEAEAVAVARSAGG